MAQYVNPFGGYATGYHQGVGEEEGIQQGARQAREQDWQHQYLDPLWLDTAKRGDAYGNFADPFQRQALAPGLEILKDRAAGSRLGLGDQYATDTGQTGMLDAAAHQAFPNAENYWTPEQYQRSADFGRNLQMETVGVRGQIAEADAMKAQAMQDWYARRYGGGPRGAAAPGAAFDPMGRIAPPGAAVPVPLTPSAPTAPAAAPAGVPAGAPDLSWMSPDARFRYEQMQQRHRQVLEQNPAAAPTATAAPAAPATTPPAGTNPQASIPAFHQMHPIHQGYVIHGVSTALGIPPEQALAHIQRQQQPQAAPAGVDASKYYA